MESIVAPGNVFIATFGFRSLVLTPFKIELPISNVGLCITLVGLFVKSITSCSSFVECNSPGELCCVVFSV